MSDKSTTRTRPAAGVGEAHGGDLGHGNSPAAWTCVFVMLFGALIACIAFVIGPSATWLFIVGIVIMLIGLLIGFIMRKAGYGVGGSKLKGSGSQA